MNQKEQDLIEYAVICGFRYVGKKLYDRANEIQLKYPEAFPWEAKYRSIPKEVHEAYQQELSAYHRSQPSLFEGAPMGIIAISKWMEEQNQKERERTKDFTPKQRIDELMDSLRAKEKREALDLKSRKRIWDNHYKPYKLAYRNEC